jgi:hypothetical protein
VEPKMEDLNLTSSSGVQESSRDHPVDLTTQPENGVAATGPPQRYFQLVAVINHMQWMLNCYTNRSLLGPHLTDLRRDIVAMAETTSVLTADPPSAGLYPGIRAHPAGPDAPESVGPTVSTNGGAGFHPDITCAISFCPLHAVQPFTSTTSTKPV